MEDETYEAPDDININEYYPHEEDPNNDDYLPVLNIYTYYFKQINNKANSIHMFDSINIDDSTSTNKCLESLYEEMFKFKNSNDHDKDMLYDPDDKDIDINKCKELYTLYIDNEPKYICKYILPLMYYLITLKWLNINWFIVSLRN